MVIFYDNRLSIWMKKILIIALFVTRHNKTGQLSVTKKNVIFLLSERAILLTQRWYHSYVNWMQHCNFMVKNKSKFLFIFFVFSHTNGVISWNAFYRQLPCFDVMGHISKWSSLYNISKKHMLEIWKSNTRFYIGFMRTCQEFWIINLTFIMFMLSIVYSLRK